MSENPTDCSRFEAFLLDGAPETEIHVWHTHLEECEGCRTQWVAHQMLEAVFAEEAVPELSPGFETGLQRKLNTAIEVKPLRGWGIAAMVGYTTLAVLFLGWIFSKFPLPSISIDPTSSWTLGITLVAVPITLWLTIGITRWLPSQRRIDTRALGLL